MSYTPTNIGIVIVATNSYFILGLRLIKKFQKYYRGNYNITYYFFSDTDPRPYLESDVDVVFVQQYHSSWADGTNSKFKNILLLENCKSDYLFYFDADTDIDRNFTEDWFLGDLVGGEHFGNKDFMLESKPFDRNPYSKAYIPYDTQLEQIYYYGAFFGGTRVEMIRLCKILRENQVSDKEIPYEPAVNDESYINQYFHYNPPQRIVPSDKFPFLISDKGGIGETRDSYLDISSYKEELLKHKDSLFDIRNGKIRILT